jgi:hypothetical protein
MIGSSVYLLCNFELAVSGGTRVLMMKDQPSQQAEICTVNFSSEWVCIGGGWQGNYVIKLLSGIFLTITAENAFTISKL